MRIPLSIALILAATCAYAQVGKIHPDPAKPRPGFQPHNLSFETPQDGVARAEFRSAHFYAVILKTFERCKWTEKERSEIQALFPKNKVFAPKDGCNEDDPHEDPFGYTNVNAKVGFIAVYAGDTQEEAQRFLEAVKQTGRFAGANLRRMQAVLYFP
jgi:hypothetical protein